MQSRMKLYSYIVKTDKGLAPNPFWGYCTLALCTPNHMGIKANRGDWIVGFTNAARGNKLVFGMEVLQRIHFNEYIKDPRFQRKKPVMAGTWQQRCGDNMYWQDEEKWCQLDSPYHFSKKDLLKDTKHPYVFVSKHFFYFGKNAIPVPREFDSIIWKKQGCKYDHDPADVRKFLEWLQQNYSPGRHGEPLDGEMDSQGCTN
jgi:hypothetical protein